MPYKGWRPELKMLHPFNMWSLKLAKESFKFSGAHFTTFSESEAEPLHGHNYYVSVILEDCASLTHGMIVDLNKPKKQIKELLKTLDEKVLIAQNNPFTKLKKNTDNVLLNFGTKEYSFPKVDCSLLPLENITIEELSGYIGNKLVDTFKALPIKSFSVEVSETRGQSCVYKVSL